MDLYSGLFNVFEEPFMDQDGKIDQDRREFLQVLGVAGAVPFGEAGLYKGSMEALDALGGSGKGYEGVLAEYQNDGGFLDQLDSIYENGFPGFDDNRPNVLIDVVEVGDNYLEEEVVEAVESIHDDHGVNAVAGRRQEKYPVDRFRAEYGSDVNRILGSNGYQGFMEKEDMIFPAIQEAAVQVVMAPGKTDHPVGWLENPAVNSYEDRYRTGFATDSVAVGSDTAFDQVYSDLLEGKKRVVMHEIGHAYGLGHSSNPEDVMYSEVDTDSNLDFTDQEWRAIKRNLS